MKSFDAFGRPVQEFQVKTNFGGYLSVCSLCAIGLLFLTELRYFLEWDTKDDLVIDQDQDQKYLNISFNITLPQVPCQVLTMNLLDPKEANVMHVVHEIYKTRLSEKGTILGRKVRDSLLNVARNPNELFEAASGARAVRTSHATTHLRCPSCFQSHLDEDDCCATCEDIRKEFRSRGWEDRAADYVFGQCAEEAYATEAPQEREGCRIEAVLHVRKVPATIHLGVGRWFRHDLVKAASLRELLMGLDFSHEVSGLSFGPDFPGLVHVLDGQRKNNHVADTSEHYQYDIHVIPTRYNQDGEKEVVGHQYSVTEYMRTVDIKERLHQDPAALGLWVSYDFTPFEVKVTRSRKSIFHFLTECCAIVGGIFAFTGMLDNFAFQMQKSAGARRSARMELAAMSGSGVG